ncbi:hypothetical protein [Heyndrickxia acidiproducens]|nr:hypothetical protein [Heyndrickxia acidiproducens]
MPEEKQHPRSIIKAMKARAGGKTAPAVDHQGDESPHRKKNSAHGRS